MRSFKIIDPNAVPSIAGSVREFYALMELVSRYRVANDNQKKGH